MIDEIVSNYYYLNTNSSFEHKLIMKVCVMGHDFPNEVSISSSRMAYLILWPKGEKIIIVGIMLQQKY